ncbi:hypothetical protein HBH69_227410 [Parastagonospora nodorum]|nr:hypothetical protein HBI03_237440 [Parastagonospora nodorum]KAH4784024.1 hypothetical protein HBH63_116940 [Parastagonospora nodorum]KAH5137658.1 hypothetical protein HBH69_227410 [Parastagonospora nodorum]KAH5239438.1 hypothetical protein HBI71_224560 [Parastagonospora nodorum]KAH5241729.1 hypothetical protein HBI72_203080 [Parastagonospora nodorum]
MKFASSFALACLSIASVEAFVLPPQHEWMRALGARANIAESVKRQIEVGDGAQKKNSTRQEGQKPQRQNGGGLTIGGLNLGGGQKKNGTEQQGQKGQRQKGSGLTIGGLTLGGEGGGISAGGLNLGGNGQQKGNATAAAGGKKPKGKGGKPAAEANKPAAEANKPAAEANKPAAEAEKSGAKAAETAATGTEQASTEKGAGAGTENQPGRAEGEAAKEEALKEAAKQGQGEAAQAEKSNGVKATEESERFSEESGITVDQAGNAQNLGGNLGITQGSDGSKSVGGENGINIAASGEATVAGNDEAYMPLPPAKRVSADFEPFPFIMPSSLCSSIMFTAPSFTVNMRARARTLRHAMSTRGGNAEASRAHSRSPTEDPYSPSLTDAETIGDDEVKERESDGEDPCKHRILLTFAETRIMELKGELVKMFDRAKAAEERALEADKTLISTQHREVQVLSEQLEKAIRDRSTISAVLEISRKETEEAQEEAATCQAKLQATLASKEELVTELQEARNTRPSINQTAVNHLHATITARDAKIEQLVDKYDKLTTEHFNLLKQINKDGEETLSARAKAENQAAELKELRASLAATETKLDWYKNERTRLLAENRSHADDRLFATSSIFTENTKLKEEIRNLKKDIANNITDLDLADADWRVFTCRHDTFNAIPDGRNSTREKTMRVIATEIFLDHANDAEFMREYNDSRAVILNHHRAHERVNQGRGDWASNLKDELYQVDQRRGLVPSYR